MRQIHISVLGTKIASDAIEYRKKDFVLDARVVEKSPFAYTCDETQEQLCQSMALPEITLGNKYKDKIFYLDFCKQVYSYVKQFNSDMIVLDMLCMRNFIYELEFDNGTVYRLTWDSEIQKQETAIKQYLEKVFSAKIISETRSNPLTWPEEKLKNEIKRYCEKLKREFSGKQVVLLEGQNIYQYFDKLERFGVLSQVALVNQYNHFYDLCVKYFKRYCNCVTISKTKTLYGNEKAKPANMFHYNFSYYDYINQCLTAIYKNEYSSEQAANILNRHNLKNEIELKELLLKSIVDLTYSRYRNRKIIVVGEVETFSYLLKKKYGLEVFQSIYFDEMTTVESVKERLSPYAWQNEKYMVVVTRLYAQNHILRTLWEMGYGCNTGYYCINHPLIELKDFYGNYEDFYGNQLDVKTPITIKLAGCGTRVSIGSGKISSGSFFLLMHETDIKMEDGIQTGEKRFYSTCYDGSSAYFGENTYLGSNFHLRNSFFFQMQMGKNCVLEDNSLLFNGDGHAIFDLNTNQNINYNLTNTNPQKHKILLGDRVRIGKHAFVLSGSQIPSGCMVEAESFVNKVFQHEKSFLAGFPAVEVEE